MEATIPGVRKQPRPTLCKTGSCLKVTLDHILHKNECMTEVFLNWKDSHSKDANDWPQFKKCRYLVNNEIKKAQELYCKRALDENEGNSRHTWRIINELTSSKTNNCCIREIKSNGNPIYSPPELADAFNDLFSSTRPKLASQIYSNNGPSHLHYLDATDKCFKLKSTNPSKVFSLFV